MTASYQTIEKEIAERVANIVEKAERIDQLARKADDAIADLGHALKDCRARVEAWAPPSEHFRLCYTQINGKWKVGIYYGAGEVRVLQDEPALWRIAAGANLHHLAESIDRELGRQLEAIQKDPMTLPMTPLMDSTSPSILASPESSKSKK